MPSTMSSEISSRFTTVARLLAPDSSLSLPAAFGEQLSDLYGLVQRSSYVFGSPLGPFFHQGRQHQVPRFVYFGPNAGDASVRLAFLAGFDHRDLRGTLALLHFIEGLALEPEIGHGLSFSLFPLVDVLGLTRAIEGRTLAPESWARSAAPELALLEKDARLRGYHGFVRLEMTGGDDTVGARLRTDPRVEHPTPAVEFITSEEVAPFAVRWESSGADAITDGPLTIADDLPFQPFELTLRLPAAWSPELAREATASILRRFVFRYRGFMAYGQHL
jgi:hypothetical protein